MVKRGTETRNRTTSPDLQSPIDSPTVQSPIHGASQAVKDNRRQTGTYFVHGSAEKVSSGT